MILEHHADAAPRVRDASAPQFAVIAAVDDHLAARRPLQQRDEFQQRALARARVAGDEGHLAGGQLEVHFDQRIVVRGVAFADVLESNHLTI